MRHIDIEKKRPSRWPWILGLVVLVLALWGVTVLLATPDAAEEPDIGVTAADTLPPARIPGAPGQTVPLDRRADLPDLTALGDEHMGQRLRVEGAVVATGNDAFWVLVGSQVLRVDSPRPARQGDTVAVRGTLQQADPTTTDRLSSQVMSRHPDFERWTVVRTVKLVEEDEPDEELDDEGDDVPTGDGPTRPG